MSHLLFLSVLIVQYRSIASEFPFQLLFASILPLKALSVLVLTDFNMFSQIHSIYPYIPQSSLSPPQSVSHLKCLVQWLIGFVSFSRSPFVGFEMFRGHIKTSTKRVQNLRISFTTFHDELITTCWFWLRLQLPTRLPHDKMITGHPFWYRLHRLQHNCMFQIL